MPPVLLDTADLASVMSDAVSMSRWAEEDCRRLDAVARDLARPGAEVSPAVVIDLVRATQKTQRWAAGHALLTAQVLVGAAEKAESRPKGLRARLARWLTR